MEGDYDSNNDEPRKLSDGMVPVRTLPQDYYEDLLRFREDSRASSRLKMLDGVRGSR